MSTLSARQVRDVLLLKLSRSDAFLSVAPAGVSMIHIVHRFGAVKIRAYAHSNGRAYKVTFSPLYKGRTSTSTLRTVFGDVEQAIGYNEWYIPCRA